MQRTPLYLYLEKMANGEESYAPKLFQQLSDRLIYVPILQSPEGGGGAGGNLTVRVVRIDEGEDHRVPIFTTEKLYKGWATSFASRTKFISLLGGDFCAALSPRTAVVIDPTTAHSVTLKPAQVKQVALASPEDSGESNGKALPEPEAIKTPELLRGRSEPTSYMQRPKATSGVFEQPEPEPIAKPSGGGLFAGAFAAGTDENGASSKSAEPGVNDTLTQPIDPAKRPVIFSPDSDSNRVVREKEDPTKKKKRSFLSFLKGS